MDDAIAKRPPVLLEHIDTNMWTAPFWEAAKRHELVTPRCGDCGHFRMPPTPFCPECRSQSVDWQVIAGNGVVFSYTVVTRAIIAGMEDDIPYVPAVIELPEAGGVRLISNIVDCPISVIEVGAACEVVWNDVAAGYTLPVFRLLATLVAAKTDVTVTQR